MTTVFDHAAATLWTPLALFALAVSYSNFFMEHDPVRGSIWLMLSLASMERAQRYVRDELFFDAEENSEAEAEAEELIPVGEHS